jgi:hypothetical protein
MSARVGRRNTDFNSEMSPKLQILPPGEASSNGRFSSSVAEQDLPESIYHKQDHSKKKAKKSWSI